MTSESQMQSFKYFMPVINYNFLISFGFQNCKTLSCTAIDVKEALKTYKKKHFQLSICLEIINFGAWSLFTGT